MTRLARLARSDRGHLAATLLVGPLAAFLMVYLTGPADAPARAQAVVPAPPVAPPAPAWRRDIRDYGAVPGTAAAASVTTRTAIQAAIDSCPAAGGEVYVPACSLDPKGQPIPWCLDRCVFLDRPNVSLIGDGTGRSVLALAPQRGGAAILAGIPRGQPISGDHYPDLFSRLDATVAKAPGTRFGYRTKGDSHATFGGMAFAAGTGDFWATAPACTIEFAVDGPVPACGVIGGTSRGWGDPVVLASGSTQFVVSWSTADGTLTGGQRWLTIFPTLTTLAPGTHRVVVQVDLVAPSLGVWVDGTRQKARSGTMPADMANATTKKMRAWQGNPWQIGLASSSSTANPDYFTGDPSADLSLLALRVSAMSRYADADALTRLDGKVITDANMFEATVPGIPDAGTVAYLKIAEAPADLGVSRRVPLAQPTGNSFGVAAGVVVEPWQGAPAKSTSGVAIKGLTVKSSNVPGDVLVLGTLLDFTAEDGEFFGGNDGVTNWNWGASNYVNRFRRCRFAGQDAAFRAGARGMNELYGCGFPQSGGRYCIWNSMALVRGANLFDVGFGQVECFYRGDTGATADLRHVDIDIEDARSPTYAAFYSETATARGMDVGGLTLDDINMGSFLKSRPIVKLVAGPGTTGRPGWLDLRGHWVYAQGHPALVDCDGGWAGMVNVRWSGPPAVMGPGAGGIVVGNP